MRERTRSQPGSTMKRTKRRATTARKKAALETWDRPGTHERRADVGAGPYEVCYDVALGYCTERAILLR